MPKHFKGYDLDGVEPELFPKLRPGMICEMSDRDHTPVMYLADTAEGRHTGYALQYFAVVDLVGVQGVRHFSDPDIAAIYADTGLTNIGDPMVLAVLKKHLRLRDNPIWKKPPEAVREMTVDQISENWDLK